MNFIARVRYWLLLIPLLALLALTYWLNQQVRPDSIKLDNTSRHQPDAIVENFSAIKLGVQGTPSLIIAAQKMLHFPDGDSTTLEMPHITSLSAERPTIHISAKRGILSSKGDEIFLHDNVEILREDSASQDWFRLQTEYLHIIPDQDRLSTDRAVTAFDPHSTVHAIGLEMDNQARTIKLLSNVVSEYVPNQK